MWETKLLFQCNQKTKIAKCVYMFSYEIPRSLSYVTVVAHINNPGFKPERLLEQF